MIFDQRATNIGLKKSLLKNTGAAAAKGQKKVLGKKRRGEDWLPRVTGVTSHLFHIDR